MVRHIRVVARPHDPVVLHRLVRVLIAQAQVELSQQRLKAGDADGAAGEPTS